MLFLFLKLFYVGHTSWCGRSCSIVVFRNSFGLFAEFKIPGRSQSEARIYSSSDLCKLDFSKRGSYTRHSVRLTIVSFLCERKTMLSLDNSINDLTFWSITIRIRFLIYQVPYYDN